MDLSQGKFVDDTQETILVKDKAINGYGSDTPHVAKLRYGASDEASTYKRQEEQTNLFLDSLKGAVRTATFGMGDKEFSANVATAGLTTATSMFYGAEMAGASIPTFIKNVGLGYKYYADLLFKSEEERNSPEYMAQWAERQKTEEAVLGAVQEVHKRSEEVANKIVEALGAGQDSIGAFVGQTTGSVLTSLGICYLTKNPTLTAAAFALPAYENVLGTSTENGKDLTASTGVALSVGTATGILERWGFQNFIEGITTKTLKGAITKVSSTELVEELSQQSVEDAALIYWSKDKKFVDENGKINWGAVLFDLSAAAFGGALGGALGAGGGVMLAQREMNNQRNNTIEQLTKGEKYTRGEAETIVTYLESGEDAARKKYEETYVQGVGEQKSYDDFIKNVPEITKAKEVFDEAAKQASDPVQAQGVVSETLNEILDPANLPKESLDEYAKQVKDNKERIDSEAIAKAEEERKKYDVRDIVESKGADKRTIDATKEAVQSFAESEAEEFGITPREAVEGKTLTVANLADNSGLSPQEKQQILEQSGLAKEETVVAKESGVAPTQEEIDEAYAMMDAEQDKGYIPNTYMQKEQDIVQRINEIDVEEKANGVPEYTAPTININGVERPTTNSEGNPIARSEKSLRYFYNWFGDSKVVDEQGRPQVIYHGTKRGDRVGSRFRKDRATSGPMAFSTTNKEIAEGYAKTKQDTSLMDEIWGDYNKWFSIDVNGKEYTLDKVWSMLDYETMKKVREKAPHITVDYDSLDLPVVYDESAKNGNGGYRPSGQYNNAIRDLVDAWLTSGSLYGREERFIDILEMAGIPREKINYVDPNADKSKVYEMYASIQNPLDTSNIDEKVIKKLKENAKKQENIKGAYGVDAWDKQTMDASFWIEQLDYDLKTGSTNVWTSIPDWVTDTLKSFGYDGIKDKGGKHGGELHTVWIPFEENQYKATTNRGTFSTENNDIYYQSEQQPRAFIDFQDEANVLVGMLNSADISALPHEMVHGFTRLHVQNCIKYNKFSSIEDVMKYFGVTDPMELITNVDIQERMARMGIKYVQESEAPTAGLRRYFEMFKRFGKKLVSGWKSKGLIDEEELPDEVRKFFDSLLGKKKKEKIDYERISEQKADVIQAIKRIKAGEAVDVSGLPISEVRKLMKVMQTRIPKMPQNLKNALIQAGGIDSEFAKNFGFIQSSGEEKNYRLFKRNGAINTEDALVEFLETNGFIPRHEVEDYDDLSSQWERVEQAIENMDNTYRESDMEKVLERESIEEGIGQATDIIRAVGAEDAFEVIEDIDKLKGRVVAEKEYLESLERKVKNLDKDYKKLYDQLLKDQAREFAQETKEQVKQAKNEIKDYRNQVIDFIKKQDLELKDKAKLISVVKRANTKASFEKVINDVKERAATLYRKEQVRRLSDLIQKEVSTKRPALKEQKYAYEENKLFSDLRDWNKLNKADAGIRYEAMHNDEEFMGNLTREDEIRLLFLEYKAMGADASPQLLNTLLDYIQIAKRVGMESRNEQEYNKAMSLDDTKNEMIKQVEQRKGKPTVYVKWVSNLYSSLYTIFGKDIADKYELETIQNRANIKAEQHIDKVVKEVMALYGSKSKGDFLNVIAELGKKVATITTVSKDIDTPLSKQGVTRELSTLEIMDIYNAIKNEKTRDDYYYWYGKDQIDSVLSKLTNKEMLWADMMMKSVDERYAPVNESFVKNYYTDLPKVDNYWMATSEHKETKTVFDVQGDFNQQSPSFLKERVKSRVLPKPTNAYSKYTKHIKGTFWVTEMADKQVELLNAISSIRVKNAVENKLGKDTYSALKRQVESLSFGGLMEDVDFVTGVIDKAINNVVVAKISLGIPVFTGQLSSVGLYAENMGAGEWAVEFAKGLAQPRKTYEFMKANVGDFLMNRFGGGYDETIGSVLREAEEGKGKYSLSPKTKYNVVSALTSFVRTGDIGAIIFGGYPRLKQLLETMPREEAIKQFEMETLRGQQSNVSASKSAFQQRKGMTRIFTSFRNFQYQAVRKIVDSVYGYMNGEVSATQAGKTIALYALYSPIAYELFRQLGNMLFVGTDAFKDLASKLLQAIMMQELSIVPIGNDVVNYGIKKYLGQYAKSGITTVGVDDLFRAIDKSYKKQKDVYDYGEIVSPFIEMMTGFPSQRIISTTKKVLEKYD